MIRRSLGATAVLSILSVVVAHPASAADLERVVTGLELPVSIVFAPDGRLFVAEQHRGDIRIVQDGRLLPDPFAHIDVVDSFEQGLLGIALHPAFPREPWVYAYYSDPVVRLNRVVRIRAQGDVGQERQVILDLLTTERGYHNGGDMTFGPDGMLYVTVGDVHDEGRAQDPNDPGGKVLRVDPDGSVPVDNPFGPTSPVYSMGHRNSFGICVDPSSGALWETENGPSGHDEINRLEPGGDFGWPLQLGPGGEDRGFIDPVVDFPDTIVPTGCAVWDGDLYFAAYADGAVRRLRLPLQDPPVVEVVVDMDVGITDLTVGPDGALYVAATDGIHRLGERNPASIPGPTRPSGALPWIAGAAALGIILVVRLAAERRTHRDR
jgi:quinoprotein glucose dehydrogenase